jgi:thioredoxin 1
MPEHVMTFTDADFGTEIREGLVLVDFWAPWCGPCRWVSPIIEQLASDYAGKVRVGKLNVDENQNTAMTYRVMSIPTVILFKDGEPVEAMVGALPKASYQQKLDRHVGSVVN